MFAVALIPIAAYESSLLVQSERSERLRELTPAARRRGRYFMTGAGGVPPLSIRGVAPLRSALHSYRTFITRGRYFMTGAGGVPPLSIRGGRCASLRSALIPNIYYSRSLLC